MGGESLPPPPPRPSPVKGEGEAILMDFLRDRHFSLARGDDSSTQMSAMSWYIISMATGLIP